MAGGPLDDFIDDLESLDGQQVPVTEMWDDAFIQAHTEFETTRAFFEASPVPEEGSAEWFADDANDDEWDAFIADHTDFDGHDEMLSAAADQWLAAQLSG